LQSSLIQGNGPQEAPMKSRIHLQVLSLAGLLIVNGCGTVGQDVQAGRNALQTGHPDDAVVYLARAAAQDPNYKIPYQLREGVLTYLGRAYYETGRDAEARATLEKAVAQDNDAHLARVYLGLTLVRSGDHDRGAKELQSGLQGVQSQIEYLAADSVVGTFWDPNGTIRNEIKTALAQKSVTPEVIASVQLIGKLVDREIDEARRSESRLRFLPNEDQN
jgi:tetratricopeptide (TPR) repeat protein